MVAKNSEIFVLPYEDEISLNLLRNHIHFLNGEINENRILETIKWITYENLNPEYSELTLYINSNGGNLTDSFALIEIMQKSRKPIMTVGIGSVCSAAFLIFAAGSKGDGYEAACFLERPLPNGCDSCGDGDGGENACI